LGAILEHKRAELETRRRRVPLAALESVSAERSARAAERGDRHPRFLDSLRAAGPVAVIAEVKRASPSAGVIRATADPADIARRYAEAGAAAVSVLTDERYFHGSLDDLRAVRGAVSAPLLRKDFTLDVYDVVEAHACGADAVLLILAVLDDPTVKDLRREASNRGMDVLVEVHNADEMLRATDMRAPLIGVNNRNLRTFEVDLATFESLAPMAPPEAFLVAESGIAAPLDVARVAAAGARAVLVGEALMRSDDPAALMKAFRGGEAPPCA
jgi:indole-3-glycerol phosphate synthase